MKNWIKRLRGALGIGAVGAAAFNLIGWVIVGVESVAAGAWPSLTLVARMCMFTIPVGGFVGLMTAGAIVLGGRRSHSISKGRAFLLGLPLGAAGGLFMSMTAATLPLSSLIVNALTVGLGTAVLGASAVAIAEAAKDPPMLEAGEGRASAARLPR